MKPMPEARAAPAAAAQPGGGPQRDATAILANPPSQPRISYRLGVYETFYQAMLDHLSEQSVTVGAGGIVYPLAKLTTRDSDDLAIALLDLWAIVCDIVTFYQERIANEGYLRTAVEKRSVLELARAIGYEFRPGVAASGFLVFTIDPALDPIQSRIELAAGLLVQSTPTQDKPPQDYETSERIEAQSAWNSLRPRMREPQTLRPRATSIELAGTELPITLGQPILLQYEEQVPVRTIAINQPVLLPYEEQTTVRLVQRLSQNDDRQSTQISWDEPLPLAHDGLRPSASTFTTQASLFGYNAPNWNDLPDDIKAGSGASGPSSLTALAVALAANIGVTGDADGNLLAWRWNVGEQTISQTGRAQLDIALPPMTSAAIMADGTGALSAHTDGSLMLWMIARDGDRDQITRRATFTKQPGVANAVAFPPAPADHAWFLSGGSDGVVYVWQIATPNAPPTGSAAVGVINGVAACPIADGGAVLALSAQAEGSLILWRITVVGDAVQIEQLAKQDTAADAAKSVIWSPDGQAALSTHTNGSLRLWKITRSGDSATLELDGKPYIKGSDLVNSAAFAPDYPKTPFFITGGSDALVRCWKKGQATPLAELAGHTMSVNGVAYVHSDPVLENGNLGFSVSGDKTVRLWNLSTGPALRTLIPRGGSTNWPNFRLKPTEIDLSDAYPDIVVGSRIVLVNSSRSTLAVRKIDRAVIVSRSDFTLTARISRLTLDQAVQPDDFDLRNTFVYLLQTALPLADSIIDRPIPDCPDLANNCIQLDQRVTGLKVGQLIALHGQTLDQGQPAAFASEMLTLAKLADPSQPYTTLIFAERLANQYQRDTVSLNANVARATNGKTIADEVLGSGDGTKANQRFTLLEQPLTYTSAPTSTGSRGELHVQVNQVEWQEAPAFYGLGPRSRRYILRTDESGQTTILFGDGQQGARLPSGQENVLATYRVGIGLAGEVEQDTLIDLLSPPLGVVAVTNPLRTSGAAPPDDRDSARRNAPLTVLTLERIVSLQDYQDFALTFAGVGRAKVDRLWNGQTQVVLLTIAGADQQEVAENALLYQNLSRAIKAASNSSQPFVIKSGKISTFNLDARVQLEPFVAWAPTQKALAERLKAAFAYERREFGDGVAASQVISAIQGVRGVLAAELIFLYKTGDRPTDQQYLPAQQAAYRPDGWQAAEILIVNPESDGIILREGLL
jgi:WD40 repeat protein